MTLERAWPGLGRTLVLCLPLLVACRRAPPALNESKPGTAPVASEHDVTSEVGAGARGPAPGAAQASSRPALARQGAPALGLPPLFAVNWIEHLDLEDGHEAYVCPPIGAREPRPLIVAVHGAGDRAEWSCGGWRMVASEYAFVACPQGMKIDATRFAWDSAETIRKRVASTVAVARARFGEYIAVGPTVFVGFSQGATLAAATLLGSTPSFPQVALAEGGYDLLRNGALLRQLRQHGVERVLLACGTPSCFTSMRAAEPRLRAEGITSFIGGDPRAGHNLNGEMQTGLQKVWPEFVAGLPNWQHFPAH